MKYEYMAIVEMNGTKYNAIQMSGICGNKRTVDTLEQAQKCLKSYTDYVSSTGTNKQTIGNFGITSEKQVLKYQKAYIKKRKVTEWEIIGGMER